MSIPTTRPTAGAISRPRPSIRALGAKWGCFRTAIAGARGTAVGTGRQNTADMLAACAERGTAADLCATYVLNGIGGWFLPSRDELALMYRNLKATGIGDFRDRGDRRQLQYWTSSQQTADMADHIDFADNGRAALRRQGLPQPRPRHPRVLSALRKRGKPMADRLDETRPGAPIDRRLFIQRMPAVVALAGAARGLGAAPLPAEAVPPPARSTASRWGRTRSSTKGSSARSISSPRPPRPTR